MTAEFISRDTQSLVRLSGPDVEPLLQGLITNDIHLLEKQPILYTALLTPQGRYAYDFFVFKKERDYYVVIEADRLSEWLKKISLYKLRHQVTIENVSEDYKIYVSFDIEATSSSDLFFQAVDPRTSKLGNLYVFPSNVELKAKSERVYRHKRYQLGIAEGAHELVPDKSVILEYHFDELHALSWTKGCYMGQELMARTKHRGGIHKECCGFEILNDEENGVFDFFVGEVKVGRLVCMEKPYGLALIRREHFDLIAQQNNRVSFGGRGVARIMRALL